MQTAKRRRSPTATQGPSSHKLAVVLPTTVVGGHEHMLLEWLAAAAELGFNFTLHCDPGTELAALAMNAGFEPQDLFAGLRREERPWAAKLQRFVRALRAIARLDPHAPIMLAPGAMQAGPLFLAACVLSGRRIACYVPMAFNSETLGLSHPRWRDALARLFASRVSLWLVIDERQSQTLKKHWRIKAPVIVIPNRLKSMSGVPAERPHHDTRAAPLRMIYLGRFEQWQKGLDWLAALLRSAPAWAADMTFSFQGRGWFQSELEAVEREGGAGLVKVRPWGKASAALQEADVLILTSRFEGFPLVAIEAIHAGVPVVATRESGLEAVLPNECQFAFGDEHGFRSALEAMRSESHRASALQYSRARLSELLSATKYLDSVRDAIAAIHRLQRSS